MGEDLRIRARDETRSVTVEAQETEATLKEWVRQHHVTSELDAWKEVVEHQATPIGFELRLFGRYEPHVPGTPDDRERAEVFERLRSIAVAAIPKEQLQTKCEVEAFDGSLHLRPESHWEPEVQIAVHILHRDGYLRPVDEWEKRCAEDVQKTLRALGVQPRVWSETRQGQ